MLSRLIRHRAVRIAAIALLMVEAALFLVFRMPRPVDIEPGTDLTTAWLMRTSEQMPDGASTAIAVSLLFTMALLVVKGWRGRCHTPGM